MSTPPHAIRFIGIFAVLVGIFLYLRHEGPAPGSRDAGSGKSGVRTEAGVLREASDMAPVRKTRERQQETDPDAEVEETLAALKATLPGWTEFPEQTLQERILAANALLKKAGSTLRFGVDEKLYPSNNLLEMKVPAFSKENATPNDILRHDVKALGKHFMLSGGAVLYQDGSGG